MISETTFARGYSSFWIEHFPWLNSFCLSINKTMIQRVHSSIGIYEEPEFRSINNIIAFTHYSNIIRKSDANIADSIDQALKYAKKLPRSSVENYTYNNNNEIIIKKQVENLLKQFKKPDIISPIFPGCGIIDSCFGDLIYDSTLVEIKAGERIFQPADLKQLIIYLALNSISSTSYNLSKVCLYNPRMGYLWNSDITTFINSITDNVKEDSFDQITKYLLEESQNILL